MLTTEMEMGDSRDAKKILRGTSEKATGYGECGRGDGKSESQVSGLGSGVKGVFLHEVKKSKNRNEWEDGEFCSVFSRKHL